MAKSFKNFRKDYQDDEWGDWKKESRGIEKKKGRRQPGEKRKNNDKNLQKYFNDKY